MPELRKAAFAMGCFWRPEALFGALDGVVRTRVGYAGGSKKEPSYQDLGDHTETVLAEYDPGKISYRELLDIFWSNHDYTRRRKTQYRSRIFYLTEDQEQIAEKSMEELDESVETTIEPLEGFHVAEDYHQKYRLRHSKIFAEIERFEEMNASELRDSKLAAKANAVAAGNLDKEDLENYQD